MKRNLFFLITGILAPLCWACADSGDFDEFQKRADGKPAEKNQFTAEDHGMAGKKKNRRVKTIEAVTWQTQFFNPDSNVFEKKIRQEFDAHRKLIRSHTYLLDSTRVFSTTEQLTRGDTVLVAQMDRQNVKTKDFTVDTSKYVNGRIVEKASYRADEEGKLSMPSIKFQYTYDRQKRLKSSTQDQQGSRYTCHYTYDEKNRLIRKSCDGRKASLLTYEELYDYNSRGLKIMQTETSYEDHRVVTRYKRYYQYNASDSLIFESWYRNGEVFLITNREFNQEGQHVADFIYDGSGGTSVSLALKHYYYYTHNGNLKMHVLVGNYGDPLQTELYAYDKDDNLIEKREFINYTAPDRRQLVRRYVTHYRYSFE